MGNWNSCFGFFFFAFAYDRERMKAISLITRKNQLVFSLAAKTFLFSFEITQSSLSYVSAIILQQR